MISIMESKFVVLGVAGKEEECWEFFIHEIPLWPKPIVNISIHCDSVATLVNPYNQVHNGKSRHLDIRRNMIRELIMNDVVLVLFVRAQ